MLQCWAWARLSTPTPQNLVIHNAFVHGRDPAILSDYAQVSMIDPMTQKFLDGLAQPLAGSLAAIEPGSHLNQPRDFHSSHDLQHLLLFGEAEGAQYPARWLVLYRGTGEAFDMQARQNIAAVWPHLARSLTINRSRFLQQQFPHYQHKGVALINSSGFIEVAEPLFRQLCALEWPTQFSRKIPDAVWNRWRRGPDYAGARVKFRMHLSRENFIVSQDSVIGPLDRLTRAERVVASRFAAGQSAKAIANALGLSVQTVRSQISQVYEKLNSHDKGELASYLLADAGR
jgi:DNA-binding CsgD family transcriptional regulator